MVLYIELTGEGESVKKKEAIGRNPMPTGGYLGI
jgi:hypothetical protein